MSDRKKGFVYVLTNPSFRDDWVKIGKSKREPEVRGRELYNTAVPLPYEIFATLKTEKFEEAEKMLHRTIDRISKLRIAANREFFNIAPETAYEILVDVATMLDDAEVKLYGDNVQVEKEEIGTEKRKKSARFDFYSRGIFKGETILFVDDPSIKAIVENEREVSFEGKIWRLSPLVKELYTRAGTVNASGSYQGPLFFKYKGERLTDIPVNEDFKIKNDN